MAGILPRSKALSLDEMRAGELRVVRLREVLIHPDAFRPPGGWPWASSIGTISTAGRLPDPPGVAYPCLYALTSTDARHVAAVRDLDLRPVT